MLKIILPLAGVLLALTMPRWKYFNLMGFAGLLGLLFGGALLLRFKPSILLMALGAGLALYAALLLGRLVPRLFLLVLMLLAMAATIGPRVGEGLTARIGAGLIALSLLVLGLIMVRFGLRLAWALIGSAMIYSGERTWLWIGAALALFIINWFTTRKVDYQEPAWKKILLRALLIALAPAALLLGIAGFAVRSRPVAISRAGNTGLSRLSPPGGLVWALPSEAIFWGKTDFPAMDNLDAAYVADSGETGAGVVAIRGTSWLSGRFELNSDIHKLRPLKDEAEIGHLRIASTAIVTALQESLPLLRPGAGEGEIAKSIQAKQLTHGCEADSFPPIIASGEHALDFHYMKNDGGMKAGDLVVIDIGCYAHHYASDFTRTLPVSGKFSERQRKAYGAVYDAQQAAVKLCKPGVWLATPRKFRRKGAVAAGKPPLQTGEFAPGKFSLELAARDTLRARGEDGDFGHGVGHPLGLFVHDVFDWKQPLQPGMVIMIEPGLYLKAEKTGIRLEDAYLVTKDGCELLTTGFPADPDAIERRMAPATR